MVLLSVMEDREFKDGNVEVRFIYWKGLQCIENTLLLALKTKVAQLKIIASQLLLYWTEKDDTIRYYKIVPNMGSLVYTLVNMIQYEMSSMKYDEHIQTSISIIYYCISILERTTKAGCNCENFASSGGFKVLCEVISGGKTVCVISKVKAITLLHNLLYETDINVSDSMIESGGIPVLLDAICTMRAMPNMVYMLAGSLIRMVEHVNERLNKFVEIPDSIAILLGTIVPATGLSTACYDKSEFRRHTAVVVGFMCSTCISGNDGNIFLTMLRCNTTWYMFEVLKWYQRNSAVRDNAICVISCISERFACTPPTAPDTGNITSEHTQQYHDIEVACNLLKNKKMSCSSVEKICLILTNMANLDNRYYEYMRHEDTELKLMGIAEYYRLLRTPKVLPAIYELLFALVRDMQKNTLAVTTELMSTGVKNINSCMAEIELPRVQKIVYDDFLPLFCSYYMTATDELEMQAFVKSLLDITWQCGQTWKNNKAIVLSIIDTADTTQQIQERTVLYEKNVYQCLKHISDLTTANPSFKIAIQHSDVLSVVDEIQQHIPVNTVQDSDLSHEITALIDKLPSTIWAELGGDRMDESV